MNKFRHCGVMVVEVDNTPRPSPALLQQRYLVALDKLRAYCSEHPGGAFVFEIGVERGAMVVLRNYGLATQVLGRWRPTDAIR